MIYCARTETCGSLCFARAIASRGRFLIRHLCCPCKLLSVLGAAGEAAHRRLRLAAAQLGRNAAFVRCGVLEFLRHAHYVGARTELGFTTWPLSSFSHSSHCSSGCASTACSASAPGTSSSLSSSPRDPDARVEPRVNQPTVSQPIRRQRRHGVSCRPPDPAYERSSPPTRASTSPASSKARRAPTG